VTTTEALSAFVLALFAGALVAVVSALVGLHYIWGGAFTSAVLVFVMCINAAKRRKP
jgi:hypothetical protein